MSSCWNRPCIAWRLALLAAVAGICGSVPSHAAISSNRVGWLRAEVPPNALQLVACPFDALPQSAACSAVVGRDNDAKCIEVTGWDPVAQATVCSSSQALDSAVRSLPKAGPGGAFWVGNESDVTQSVVLAGYSPCLQDTAVRIQPGINLLGNPFLRTVALSQLEGTGTGLDASDLSLFSLMPREASTDTLSADAMVDIGCAVYALWGGDKAVDAKWAVSDPEAEVSADSPITVEQLTIGEKEGVVALTVRTRLSRGTRVRVYARTWRREDIGFTEDWVPWDTFRTDGDVCTWVDRARYPGELQRLCGREYWLTRADDGSCEPMENTTPKDASEIGHLSSPLAQTRAGSSGGWLSDELVQMAVTPGGTVFVNAASGDDRFDGRAASPGGSAGPKRTLRAAVACVRPDETIQVFPGRYPERVDVRGKAVTIHCNGQVEIR